MRENYDSVAVRARRSFRDAEARHFPFPCRKPVDSGEAKLATNGAPECIKHSCVRLVTLNLSRFRMNDPMHYAESRRIPADNARLIVPSDRSMLNQDESVDGARRLYSRSASQH